MRIPLRKFERAAELNFFNYFEFCVVNQCRFRSKRENLKKFICIRVLKRIANVKHNTTNNQLCKLSKSVLQKRLFNLLTLSLASKAALFVCLFCWMEALSVCSDHCRAMEYRISGVTVVLGEIDDARVKPKPRPRKPPVRKTSGTHPSSRGGGRLLSGGHPEVASVPVDDVHQARSA